MARSTTRAPQRRPKAMTYREFVERKVEFTRTYGAPVAAGEVHPRCKPHQRDIVRWAVEGGRRAIFAKFGLGKTYMQLEAMRLTLANAGGVGLIVAPLGVRQEFLRDAAALGIALRCVRTTAEMDGPGLYLTHYEAVRDGKVDARRVTAVALDEASVLRGMGGTKTFRAFMRLFADAPYRFVATATPSPNNYIEILAYAAFLGVMDIGEAKTRFFQRDSEKADNLTLYPHKVEEFWVWVSSWAVFLQKPSDLGYSDEGYDLPALTINWHAVGGVDGDAGAERDGQGRLLRDSALGVQEAAAERRAHLAARVAKARALVEARPDEHVILWHDLEDERHAIEAAIPGVVSVYGNQDLDAREAAVVDFAEGRIPRLAAKPVMLGSGCNLQRHCAWAVFVGVNFKFNDLIQAVHRIYRFLQTREVTIDIVYAASEATVVRKLLAKWQRHEEMMRRMGELIRAYGLNTLSGVDRLKRTIGVERREARGEGWVAVHNDTVEETAAMPSDSVGLIVTSIPFGTQYEYSPNYCDFGHTDDDRHFWRQMRFLTPELLRVLMPGRVLAVHVKDRIRPGGLDGFGFQTAYPFHADAIHHYRRRGFAYLGMVTIETDVVRENNQTYRLGWTEQCKDGSRMGVGMPEYVLLFRKPPSDPSTGYADVRVVKSKAEYSRGRWQTDAHGKWRAAGDRLLTPDEVRGLPADQLYQRWREYSTTHVYDYARHVALAEALDEARRLPPGFALIPPHAWRPDVWSDVARMRSLNTMQAMKGKEQHLCPLPFDIVDRLIARYSNPGDEVFDPFGGLMTVPLRAIETGRRGRGHELNAGYWADGVRYLRAAEEKMATPTLFDALELAGATEAA